MKVKRNNLANNVLKPSILNGFAISVLKPSILNGFKMPIFALALVCLSLTGCNTFKDVFKVPPKATPPAYSEPATASTITQIAPAWWTHFQDAELNTLVEQSLKNNHDITAAVARIEEADANLRQVGAGFLPTVNVSSGVARQRTFAPGFNGGINPEFTLYQAAIGTQYELDFWGKIKLAQQSARAQLLASQFSKATTELTLSSLVAHYYLSVISLDAQSQVLAKILDSRQQSLLLTKKRLEGGVVSVLDVYQAENAILQSQLQMEEFKRLRSLALHQLQLLTNLSDLTVLKWQKVDLPNIPVPPVGLPANLLLSRPDIQIAEQNLTSLQANIGFARAAFYPSFSLTAEGGLQSALLADFIRNPVKVFTLGLGLNLPIFDSGRRQAQLDIALAQEKQALANYAKTIQIAFKEVNDGLSDLQQYAEKERLLAQSVSLAEKTVTVAQSRYQAGYSSYLEVLDAERNLIEANLQLVQTRQTRLQSSIALFKALGGGWQLAEIKKPN